MKKTPVMMSALVCPGIGQFMQGRRLAGSVFLFLTLTGFTALMVFFIKTIIGYYKLGLTFEDPGDMRGNFFGIALSFAITMFIYILSLFDTVRASQTPPPLPPDLNTVKDRQ